MRSVLLEFHAHVLEPVLLQREGGELGHTTILARSALAQMLDRSFNKIKSLA